jgi:alpha-N-acetylglucosamine transferase
VVLVAFGKHVYYGAAYNLAYSIKRFNKDIQIACIIEGTDAMINYAGDLSDVTDIIIEIKHEHLYTNGKLDPGKAKVFIYDYLPFESNIYLDVDAVALKDIQPMIDELIALGKPYASHIMGYHTIDKGKKIESMVWAYADDIWERYGLSESTILPAINSSIQFIQISPKAHALYKIAQDYYVNNPIPINKLRFKWGNGQPDELYMNIALAKLEMDPATSSEYVHITTKRGLGLTQVSDQYYLQSYFGGQGYTPNFYVEWLDRLMRSWMSEQGKIHKYLIKRIVSGKHVENKR